ncbi:hypothetical protein FO470_02000 [Starkeya sp. 3C]|uniref:Ribbon-helix-helix protein CopG domain-containing protein n=1 Tax=Ancylobacter moscoviensis TaxID=2597768 RepID=A0ABY3DUG7_9HYPH|nr:hypothetical protein [Ancylobacter moscoviensis]TSJ64097.1 hypothetical protein FO470_02000 [Ancylobacter moscoviensis]
MATRIVQMALNQQQLELIDRTVASGVAADRAALVRHALRRYAARHLPPQDTNVRPDASARPNVAVG